ncbi:MAG: hypothetical protein E5Y10_31780 [Mesorhizobium sp.]|nr:MAG: hypothetical protein E5Y13_31545 [Mesorhizobium sp.]TJU84134.1 MAG: hypothetical protein E5Y10_31780 [Mesorhizobium sp.]
MNAFCASENFDAFIVFRSSQPRDVAAENSTFERSSFQGSEQFYSTHTMEDEPHLGSRLLTSAHHRISSFVRASAHVSQSCLRALGLGWGP